jgi:hypothetical protein
MLLKIPGGWRTHGELAAALVFEAVDSLLKWEYYGASIP